VLEVPIDKIVPVTNARARIASLVSDVQKTNSLYVLTRGGKPAAVLASVDYLNKLPARTASASNLPAEFEEKKSEIVEKEDSHADIVEQKETHSDALAEQDEGQPIKISVN